MRVLITGALGFIGSHLADAFIAQGHEVHGLDDLSGNVLDALPGVRCVTTDVRNIDQCLLPVPDLVVHTASPVGPVLLLERSSIVAEVIETTQAVIRYCERHRVPLVNISSSEVYGFSGVYRETDDCVVPHRLSHRLQYSAGKLAAEQLVRTSGLDAVSIRPFNVAGPRQSRAKGFVLPTFCEQALNGDRLTVFDGGDQERCPTAVWDVCDLILKASDLLNLGVPCPDVINVGAAHNRTSILELARLVIDVSGSKSRLMHTTGKALHGSAYEEAVGRVKVPCADVAHSLDWRPRVGLRELVQRTYEEVSGASRDPQVPVVLKSA